MASKGRLQPVSLSQMHESLLADPKVQARFWAKVNKAEGCWEWIAGRSARGYGTFRFGGANRLAHRVAYEMLRGPIPPSLTIDHLCRNRACANPAHMEPVTAQENVRRGLSGILRPKDVLWPSANRAKTHCPKNHPYDLLNTYRRPNGQRGCRKCKAEWMAAYHQANTMRSNHERNERKKRAKQHIHEAHGRKGAA